MTQASLEAFAELAKKGSTRRNQVFTTIVVCEEKGWNATLPLISKLTRLPFNSISGRLTELEREGMIWNSGKTLVNGRNYTVWKS